MTKRIKDLKLLRQFINQEIIHSGKSVILLFLFLSGLYLNVNSQTTSYDRVNNEIRFTRTINNKWSTELNLGGTFSSTPYEEKVFKTNIQRLISGWGHYYLSPRWKLSSLLGYYYNKDAPDIGQYKSPEFRFALQGMYYFHKLRYTLSTRMRPELRYIRNQEGIYEDVYRYRQQLKFQKPINSQFLRKGVFYILASDEVVFKSKAKTTGLNFFDRNQLNVGAGYLLTDNLQLELSYQNQFLPRDDGNIIYNGFSFILTVNNFLPNLKINKKPAEAE